MPEKLPIKEIPWRSLNRRLQETDIGKRVGQLTRASFVTFAILGSGACGVRDYTDETREATPQAEGLSVIKEHFQKALFWAGLLIEKDADPEFWKRIESLKYKSDTEISKHFFEDGDKDNRTYSLIFGRSNEEFEYDKPTQPIQLKDGSIVNIQKKHISDSTAPNLNITIGKKNGRVNLIKIWGPLNTDGTFKSATYQDAGNNFSNRYDYATLVTLPGKILKEPERLKSTEWPKPLIFGGDFLSLTRRFTVKDKNGKIVQEISETINANGVVEFFIVFK